MTSGAKGGARNGGPSMCKVSKQALSQPGGAQKVHSLLQWLFAVTCALFSAAPAVSSAAASQGSNTPNLLAAPHVTMQFYSDSVVIGGASLLLIGFQNPTATAITGVQFAEN